MKVLILEDNRFKFEDAKDVLKSHNITEYVHFDNCEEALDFVYEPDNIKDIDFIILDLNFYMSRDIIGGKPRMPTPNAGGKFIWQMLQNEFTIPVIVFSSEDDYMKVVNDYLLISFSEYARAFQNGPLPIPFSMIKHNYAEEMEEIRRKLLDLTFIVGHAHQELELDYFVTLFLNSVNSGE